MGQHDISPISSVRGKDSTALLQAAAFFNVSELLTSFHSGYDRVTVQYSTSLSDTRHLQNQLRTSVCMLLQPGGDKCPAIAILYVQRNFSSHKSSVCKHRAVMAFSSYFQYFKSMCIICGLRVSNMVLIAQTIHPYLSRQGVVLISNDNPHHVSSVASPRFAMRGL